MIDIDKLTPIDTGIDLLDSRTYQEAEFQLLARKAFDVMLRRGWAAVRHANGKWAVDVPCRNPPDGGSVRIEAADPFTALVDADRWKKLLENGK